MLPEFVKPQIIKKSWGEERVYVNDDYCYKVLHYTKAGKKSSLHKHLTKDEFLICTKGEFQFEFFVEGKLVSTHLNLGDGVRLRPNVFHRFTPLQEGSELTEASTHHEDYDVERLEPSDP
jgi:mannose-6-phosphate isomerase-like protein (cupin superfamily)